ncbi:MAG TPA: oxygenase MpaB family protein [Daejeonella sp.]|nr:oxygenase MpaB family protein [Daejeonella sp.]
MDYFVKPDSIVRQIWGKGDTILFIFAGASAEFALNKAVDWLYFTGKLPADPIGRLFSTVAYARQIVFSAQDDAIKAIDKITMIHRAVENQRDSQIPDWAYRDVLFMLIDYSIRAFEVLERQLTDDEKNDVFDVFKRVGLQMNLQGLPTTYPDWIIMREEHLKENLANSHFTEDLYKQYREHLGIIRFQILIEAQVMVVPKRVNQLLSLGEFPWLSPVLAIYKLSRIVKMDRFIKNIILPKAYQKEIENLDVV